MCKYEATYVSGNLQILKIDFLGFFLIIIFKKYTIFEGYFSFIVIKNMQDFTVFKENIGQRKGRKVCHCGVVTLGELITSLHFQLGVVQYGKGVGSFMRSNLSSKPNWKIIATL